MSNVGLIIEERSRDIGDFMVGRLLPFRQKRMVGPFIFIDHMGPDLIGEGHYMDIGQHPHIGISTLTYLFEGEVLHRDSIGSLQRITPGSVNFMTAGKGVVHTERTPVDMRFGQTFRMHGFQIWVALPKELEDMDPVFQHVEKKDLPVWDYNGLELTLIAGKGFGKTSPVNVYSELFMIQITSEAKAQLDTQDHLVGEIGICVVDGYIEACGERVEKGNMLVSKVNDVCNITVGENTHLLLFGGQPFDEPRNIFWNFVSTDQHKIEDAKTRWANREFPKIPDDDSYIPLP